MVNMLRPCDYKFPRTVCSFRFPSYHADFFLTQSNQKHTKKLYRGEKHRTKKLHWHWFHLDSIMKNHSTHWMYIIKFVSKSITAVFPPLSLTWTMIGLWRLWWKVSFTFSTVVPEEKFESWTQEDESLLHSLTRRRVCVTQIRRRRLPSPQKKTWRFLISQWIMQIK